MQISRRLFIRDGVATVTLGLAAPAFLSAIAQAQGLSSRRLVVVYLGGGNDALNTLISVSGPAATTAGVPRSPFLPARCCRSAPMPPVGRSGCIRGSAACRTSSTRGGSRSCSAPATRTRAARTSRPPTSSAPRIRSRRPDRAGWAAISIRCRGRSTRSPRGTRRPRRRARSCRDRPACRRSPNASTYTFASPNRGSAATQERAAARSDGRRTRRPAGRTSRS